MPQRKIYTCKFCHKNFQSKKMKQKHLWKKTFQSSDISRDLNNLTQKGDNSLMTCFCGFSHKYKSRVLSHAQRYVEEIKFRCEVCQHMAKTKLALLVLVVFLQVLSQEFSKQKDEAEASLEEDLPIVQY